MKVLETYDNLSYEITDEQHEKIMLLSGSGEAKGIWIGPENSTNKDYIAWGSIKAIHEQSHGYGQPYEELPAVGIAGLLESPKTKNAKEAMLRGLQKAKKRLTDNTPNLDKLIQAVTLGTKVERVNGKEIYKAKYETWEEAKMAGVV